MTNEQFKILAKKLESLSRNPENLEALLKELSSLSKEEINAQYRRGDSTFLPKERLLEVAIQAYIQACSIPVKFKEEYPESQILKLIQCLVKQGADLTLLDANRQPPLHQAICICPGNESVTRYHVALHYLFVFFAEQKVDFNCKNENGDNLLIRAVRTRNYALVPWLHEEYHCELNQPNKGLGSKIGETVLDLLEGKDEVHDILRYVRKNHGVSGKALSAEMFEELSKKMGSANYERIKRDRQPPKTRDQIMKELGPALERSTNPLAQMFTSLHNFDGTTIWSRNPDEIGTKVDLLGNQQRNSTETLTQETKVNAEVNSDINGDEPSKKPLVFSEAANTHNPASSNTSASTANANTSLKASSTKEMEIIYNGVLAACKIKSEKMFQTKVQGLSAETWTHIYEQAKKWPATSASMKIHFDTFIKFCCNFQNSLKENNKEAAKFPEELAKLVSEKLIKVAP